MPRLSVPARVDVSVRFRLLFPLLLALAITGAVAVPGALAATAPQPSKLELSRATIDRNARTIDILAPISARASGTVKFAFRGAGRTTTWTTKLAAGAARLRLTHKISAAQAA